MNSSPGRPASPAEVVLTALRRRLPLALGVTFVWLMALGAFTRFLPDIYRGTATLLIERQQVPEDFVRSTVTNAIESRLQAISQEVLSRSRLLDLIRELDLYADIRDEIPEDGLVERMRSEIRLEPTAVETRNGMTTTLAFAISYSGRDPERVARVANALASFYSEENQKGRAERATGAVDFLQSELEKMKARLDEQEKLVSAFKERYIGELPEQQQANLATLERLNTQLRLNGYKQVRVRQQRTSLAQTAATASGAAGTGGDSASTRLGRLRSELADLRTRFSAKYPDVQRVQGEIADLEDKIARGDVGNVALPVDPAARQADATLKSLDAELGALAAEEANLKQTIASYQVRVENSPRREQEFQSLSRDYVTTKETYASLLKRFKEAQISESLEERQKGEQFRVLDSAMVPEWPTAPNRFFLLLAAVVVSLAFGVLGAVVADRFDTSFHSVGDLRAFARIPVLVAIPRLPNEGDRRRLLGRATLGAAGIAAASVLLVGAAWFIAHGNEALALSLGF